MDYRGVYLCSDTNSTMFTKCCNVAICDHELVCPTCKEKVVGYDAASNHARFMQWWEYAYGPSRRKRTKGH